MYQRNVTEECIREGYQKRVSEEGVPQEADYRRLTTGG